MDLWKARAFALAVSATVSGSASAFVAAGVQSLTSGPVVLRPETVATDGGLVDKRTGAPRLVTATEFEGVAALGERATLSDYVAEAKAFVDSHPELVGVGWKDLTLVKDSVLIDDDVAFLDFDVRRNGILIEDANLAFRFKLGRLVQVQTQTFAEAQGIMAPGADAYRVKATADGYRLVPVAVRRGIAGDEPVTVQTDLETGAVFETKAERHYAAGAAYSLSYPRTWFQSQTMTVPVGEATLTVGQGTVTTGLDGVFQANALPRLNGFKGTRVSVVPSTGTLVVKDAEARGNDYYLAVGDTAEKALSQGMTFHHVNNAVQYAKRYITTTWFDRQLRANVNLSQTCNAYWDGSTINFYSAGGGCANTALVSDVIYHEWGHGLDANTGGISDGAFSEGYGDIMAMIMARDSVTAPGFKTDGRGIRDLSPDKIYPQDRGEVHAEGLIIGGTFWDLYQALKAKYDDDRAIDLVSKYAFKVIFTARRYTDVYAALQVIDDDDGNPANKTPNFCELNAAFTAHGLATRDAGCN